MPGPGRVLLAAPRGFCAGVDRAVETVELALTRFGAPVYVRRQIVHNASVVRDLTGRGAVFVDEIAQVPDGATVILSAHGVAPSVKRAGAARGLRVIDAVCPLVAKVHQEVRRFAAAGYEILLIGHEGHEEVVGTTGHAPHRVRLVDSVAAAETVTVERPRRTVWVSQTTLAVDETLAVVAVLRRRFPELADPPSDDICYASQNRQDAVKRIAPRCPLVLVVGSDNSSNSRRLVEVALTAGARSAHLVEDAGSVRPQWLRGLSTVGLTSGASAPEPLVRGVLAMLAGHGFTEVENVVTAREDLVFAVPSVLRPPASAGDATRPAGGNFGSTGEP